jgi:esterase/lipase
MAFQETMTMQTLKPFVAIVLTALLVACGGGGDDAGDAGSRDASPTASSGGDAAPTTVAEDKPTEEAGPVGVSDEPVRFETVDGVPIAGHLYSASGPKLKVVVLAHEFPHDQTAWTEYAQELAAEGIDALTFDFRGYGETGGEKDIAKIDLDLEAAARFIGSRDYEEVYVFGASMGGTATLKVAARLELAGVATLSAPHMVMGLDASEDVALIEEPKFFVATSGDADGAYAQLVETFMSLASEPKSSVVHGGSEHGTDILRGENGEELKRELLLFLNR